MSFSQMPMEDVTRLGSGRRERMAGAKAGQGAGRIKVFLCLLQLVTRHLITRARKQVLSLLFALLSHLISH